MRDVPLWRLGLLEDMSNHLIRKPTSHNRAEGCHLRPAVIEKQWVFFQTFGDGPLYTLDSARRIPPVHKEGKVKRFVLSFLHYVGRSQSFLEYNLLADYTHGRQLPVQRRRDLC